MGLGEHWGGGRCHLSAGPGLGIGPIMHRFLPRAFLSVCPTTGKTHVYSDSISPMLEIANKPQHAKTFKLPHAGFKSHGPELGSSGLQSRVSSFPSVLLALKVTVDPASP